MTEERVIQFRGKVKTEGQNNKSLKKGDWVYGDYVRRSFGDTIQHLIFPLVDVSIWRWDECWVAESVDIDPKTLGQHIDPFMFTNDLCGELLSGMYYGDVIRTYRHIVVIRTESDLFDLLEFGAVEHLGNIHDNPELGEL